MSAPNNQISVSNAIILKKEPWLLGFMSYPRIGVENLSPGNLVMSKVRK
jgi:hypothetical protein